ncbi:BA75_03516T0 [Komagataella pastoris]|uniref:Aldehyde dehydrogenase 5, mitochondrial n=1 Tax=Komagataella pastoris TaxID=4922 RepID=A0A1B2JEK5_PICPA|nr:BA75_03516T0 [Komagataella pastoris]
MSEFVAKINIPTIAEPVEVPTGLFINNEWVAAKSGKTFAVTSPIDESHLTDLQMAGADDVDIATDFAYKAFYKHKFIEPSVRGRWLYKLADLFEQHKDTIAKLESLDNGKALHCAQFDLNLVVEYLRSCAGYTDKVDGRTINTGKDHLNFTKREPLGVCGQIIPWNFPILMWAWKIGPAIATGNAVVLKPASATPLTALYATKLVKEAGIPAGLVNIVPGSGRGCGNAILQHPKIKKIAFTGSTAVGIDVMVAAATSNLKKVTLELGGKSPNIVFDDCDLDSTIQNLITGIFFNGGEVCCAGSRIYVQEGIYEQVLSKFKEEISKLKIGNPFEEGTYQGAQATPDQFECVLGYIERAKKAGAKLLTGGNRIGTKGYFVEPTVFYDCDEDLEIVKDEIFGPVASIGKFKDVAELVEKANNSEYGLAAGIHTQDLNKAFGVADQLEAGSIWINTYNDLHQSVPFGGYKTSGIGREMGLEAFDNYTQVKAVRTRLNVPTA